MKISMKWLNDYVDVSDFYSKPQELSALLTFAGLEVEDIENQSEKYRHVVIGHILEKGKHPDADKLSLCQVSTGQGTVHQIICGAQNHEQGDRVVVALPGAVLPGDFKIKKSKIRGVESNGMLCSNKELGLPDDDIDGIVILPENSKIGEDFAEYQGLDDVLLEISVTPNRADCLSHYGLAREISCLLDRPCKLPEIEMKASDTGDTQKKIKLKIENPELCPRYAGRYISGVKVTESPDWLKKRLEQVGMNSINNVVDVTNYVMLELGQPLHAFDADQIEGEQITVDSSKQGEKFTTLDGTEVQLSGEELMIRDGGKSIALAGIVGGQNSGVSERTANLFVESAYFNMKGVRKTSRKLGIDTDSAYRFSRGTNPQQVDMVLDRACHLLNEVAGGESFSNAYDICPQPFKKQAIEISVEFVGQKMGYEVATTDFVSWMQRLGCEVEEKGESGVYLVQPPLFRGDLEHDVDLVEEYGRLAGYDKIPETLPVMVSEPTAHVAGYSLEQMVHKGMNTTGYRQAVNHSFIGSEWVKDVIGNESGMAGLGLDCSLDMIELKNPLSEDLNVMRNSLIPGLLKNLIHNVSYGNEFGRLYETGYSFSRVEKSGEEQKSSASYSQEKRLGIVAWGSGEDLWTKKAAPLVYQIKSDVESLLLGLKSKSWKWCERDSAKVGAPGFLHSGQWSYLFYEGKPVGYIGSLHPRITEVNKIRVPVVVGEFNLELLLRGQPKQVKAKALSKFQSVERDLAFLLPNTLAAGDILAEMRKAAGKFLNSISIFDVYEGSELPEEHRSVAFRLVYQKPEETLSEEEITGYQEKVINSISQKFSVSVR